MLGLRGVRLGLLTPGLFALQVRAIAEAAIDLVKAGKRPPGRDHGAAGRVRDGAAPGPRRGRRASSRGRPGAPASTLDIPIGTMIELPRAALTAHRIAEAADFFSFGTNDLTQTDVGLLPRRRRGRVLRRLPGQGHLHRLAVRDHRRRRRRPAGRRSPPRRAAPPSPTSSSASAASTAATPSPSTSSTASASTTSPAHPSASPSPASRPAARPPPTTPPQRSERIRADRGPVRRAAVVVAARVIGPILRYAAPALGRGPRRARGARGAGGGQRRRAPGGRRRGPRAHPRPATGR